MYQKKFANNNNIVARSEWKCTSEEEAKEEKEGKLHC